MNLSILMTSVSTIVGVGAIPGMIQLLSMMFLDECTRNELNVDPLNIIKPLIITLLPCGVGMAIKKWSTGFDFKVKYPIQIECHKKSPGKKGNGKFPTDQISMQGSNFIAFSKIRTF